MEGSFHNRSQRASDCKKWQQVQWKSLRKSLEKEERKDVRLYVTCIYVYVQLLLIFACLWTWHKKTSFRLRKTQQGTGDRDLIVNSHQFKIVTLPEYTWRKGRHACTHMEQTMIQLKWGPWWWWRKKTSVKIKWLYLLVEHSFFYHHEVAIIFLHGGGKMLDFL